MDLIQCAFGLQEIGLENLGNSLCNLLSGSLPLQKTSNRGCLNSKVTFMVMGSTYENPNFSK